MEKKPNASEHFTGCARNPSYDTSLSVGERLSDYMGKFHIVLHGVKAHEPFYLDCENKPDERCDDGEKKALIEFVSLLVADERSRIVGEINNTPIDKAHTYSSENADEYRTFDNGQESYKQKLLSSLNKSVTKKD